MSPEFRFIIKGDLSAQEAGELLTKISETQGITSVDVQGFSVAREVVPTMGGEAVRAARLARKLKQTELGALVGLSKSTISNIENKRDVPKRTWNKIAVELNLPTRS